MLKWDNQRLIIIKEKAKLGAYLPRVLSTLRSKIKFHSEVHTIMKDLVGQYSSSKLLLVENNLTTGPYIAGGGGGRGGSCPRQEN